jgi:hypothetical protein
MGSSNFTKTSVDIVDSACDNGDMRIVFCAVVVLVVIVRACWTLSLQAT